MAPQPQTRRLTELVAEGAVGRVRMIRAAFGFVAHDPQQRPPEQDPRRRRADGRRLLLRERRPPDRRRARAGERRAGARRRRRRRRVRRHHAPPRRHPGHFDAGLALASRDLLEVVGDQATLRSRIRGTAATRRSSSYAATAKPSGSRSSARTPTGSRPRTSRRRSGARPSRCSAAPTRSARPGRSRRCTRRPDDHRVVDACADPEGVAAVQAATPAGRDQLPEAAVVRVMAVADGRELVRRRRGKRAAGIQHHRRPAGRPMWFGESG